MAFSLLQPLATARATPPTPEARHAIGQASTIVLVVTLIGLVLVCGAILLMLRRRARADREPRADAVAEPTDAWLESAKRVALEDDDEIPREPGTA